MDDITMKLPLRLVPGKGGAVLLCFFFLFFFGFSVFWTIMAATGVMTGGMEDEPFPGFRYAFPLFGLPFMLIGFFGLAFAVSKLLPGSPYYHVELSAQGIKVRRAWKTEQFAWSAISPFGISVRTRSTKGGRVTTHWVVALRAAEANDLGDETARSKRSVLQIDAGQYGSAKAEQSAAVMVEWLNGIRAEAIERPGRAATNTAVPPDLRGAVREIAAGTGRMAATTPARSGVIER
jgi:hypothetical protein